MSSQYKPNEIKRNYLLLLLEGILFTVGQVFFDPNTVLPLLMERLTGSVLLVGLVGAVQPLAKGVVPVLAGNWISSLRYKKRFLISVVAIGRLPLWILGVGLIVVPRGSTVFWASVLLLVQILFWFGDSAGDPAWMDLVGKSVATGRRGRFFAFRQVIGGALAIAGGAAVSALLELDALEFPLNYGVVVGIGAVIYLANVATFLGIRERPSGTSARLAVATLFRRLPSYIRRNRLFARTISILILVNLARLSLPFFIVFGRRSFGLGESDLAFILPLQIAGRIVGAALWGFLGDRYGHHTGIRGVAIAFSIPSLIALILATLSPAAVAAPAFGLLFFVLGFALEGWPPFINYMLDIVEEQERPLYAGLMSVGFVPAALAPIVGGFLIRQWGYPLLFGSATATAVCGVILATSLPRAKSDAHGE